MFFSLLSPYGDMTAFQISHCCMVFVNVFLFLRSKYCIPFLLHSYAASDLWSSSLSYAARSGLLLSLAFVLTRGQMCGYIMELEICEGWLTRWISVLLSWADKLTRNHLLFLANSFLMLCLLYTG